MPVPVELVARRIVVIRGQRVMFDSDLAELYQVQTKNLNRAVKRNDSRFPADFKFQLTEEEVESLRRQNGASNGRGGRRYLPFVFTELGVAMLSSVLNSARAVQMNITIMRAFVRLREVVAGNRMLAEKLERVTATVRDHAALFEVVIKDVEALDRRLARELQLLRKPPRKKTRIGFIKG